MIEKKTIRELDLTIFRLAGQIDVAEIMGEVAEFFEGQTTLNVLWDLTDANLQSISANDTMKVASLGSGLQDQRRGGKTALVAPGDLAFGMSRIFSSSRDSSQIETQVFRRMDEAVEWIKG